MTVGLLRRCPGSGFLPPRRHQAWTERRGDGAAPQVTGGRGDGAAPRVASARKSTPPRQCPPASSIDSGRLRGLIQEPGNLQDVLVGLHCCRHHVWGPSSCCSTSGHPAGFTIIRSPFPTRLRALVGASGSCTALVLWELGSVTALCGLADPVRLWICHEVVVIELSFATRMRSTSPIVSLLSS